MQSASDDLRTPTMPELIEKAKSISRQQKIIGGLPIEYGQSPWTVSIKYRDGRTFYTYCGGTLISDKHVLTAAHCVNFQRAEDVFVGVGDHDRVKEDQGEVLAAVLRVETHPDYR